MSDILLDFEDLAAGDFVGDQYQALGVTISSTSWNKPMVFDSSNPTGGDYDLATSNLGNVLIISEDNDSSDPDDNAGGGGLVFEFDAPSSVNSLTVLDTEEKGYINLYDADGNFLGKVDIPCTKDGGQATVNIGYDDVAKMEVHLCGSGAIDNVSFTTPDPIVDGVVDGTTGDDLIDVAYTGDPEGDMIDNGDAILPGEVGDDDIVNAGAGNDTILAGEGDDEVYAGGGDDVVEGGAGDDVIYGDSDYRPMDGGSTREVLEWDKAPNFGDNTDASGFTQNTGSVDVTFSIINETGAAVSQFETDTQNVSGIDADGDPVNANSSFYSETKGDGNDGDYALDFSEEVENVSFRINDIDGDGKVKIVAYDADGNKIPVELTGGYKLALYDTDSVAGVDTAVSKGGYEADTSSNYSLLVEIAGPVARIEIYHDQVGCDNSGINVTDVYFDVAVAAPSVPGNDSILGGIGNDIVYGEEGDDTIKGEDGDDELYGGDGIDRMTGGTGNDTMYGGEGDDSIEGDGGNDVLYGDGGNDSMEGSTDDDTLYGGAGSDTMYGQGGNDLLDGGEGDDSIIGGQDGDSILGGAGNDTIEGFSGDDLVYGGTGDDLVIGGGGDDTVFGDEGNDTIQGGNNIDVIYGGDGIDKITGGYGADTLYGGAGDDSIEGDGGNDVMYGEDGNDSMEGSTNDDLVYGGADNDTIYGQGGNDTLDGGTGDDSIIGGQDSDSILGGDGNDTIDGFSGDDEIDGGEGDDSIIGGGGDDTLSGGAGNDTVLGGNNTDVMYGGDGADSMTGGYGADSFTGGDGADTLSGEADEDVFYGGSDGDEVYGGSTGTDWDTLDLTGAAAGGGLNVTYTGPDSDGNGYDGYVTFYDAGGNETGKMTFENIEEVIPCFTPGTRIATPRGERAVEELREGDKIITRDNGIQEIAWVGQKTLTGAEMLKAKHLQPILIKAGALRNGLPERDMVVSPNHRVLVANDRTALYFEEHEVLVAAKHLVNHKGVEAIAAEQITYVHFMFDQHEVVLSDGAWTESFQPGDYTLQGMGNAQRNEIFELFPELQTEEGLADYTAARRTLKKHEARLLIGG